MDLQMMQTESNYTELETSTFVKLVNWNHKSGKLTNKLTNLSQHIGKLLQVPNCE